MEYILFVIVTLPLYLLFIGKMGLDKVKKYITGGDAISYNNAIKKVHKNPNYLQPLYEAFMNSWESINSLLPNEDISNQSITIRLFFTSIKSPKYDNNVIKFEFNSLEIEDTGGGLTEESYKRLQKLYDEGKGFNNRGSGRIQYLHFFKRTYLSSAYQEGDEFYGREVLLSKIGNFATNNSLIGEINKKTIDRKSYIRNTVTKFEDPIEEKDFNHYSKLTVNSLKENLMKQFMGLLCLTERLPQIIIEKYEGKSLLEREAIHKNDFPIADKPLEFDVFYSKLKKDATGIEETNEKEEFTLNTFKVPSNQLEKNKIEISSKGQIVQVDKKFLELSFIKADDVIQNNRYLFLLTSPYIENIEGDDRGKIEILSEKEFLKNDLYASDQVILIESVQKKLEETVINAYPEIQVKNEEKQKEIKEIKELFLLDDEMFQGISISNIDTVETILKKVFKKQGDSAAKSNAIIKSEFDNVKKLDPTKDTYYVDLEKSANIITAQIPLQDRTALTQYVARRGIVLNLFDKALASRLDIQQNKTMNIDEKILHNILFKQRTSNSEVSDLWMLNEDYVMYSGLSEIQIGKLEYKGQPIIKSDEELTENDKNRIKSLELDRYKNRLDTILFPEEGKCIILEYKNPTELLSKHVSQIQNYATLIYNYSKDYYKIDTFFGYLIGDRFDYDDIIGVDPDYAQRVTEHGSFIYKKGVVAGYNGKEKGTIYLEVLNYNTVLERARKRNKILFNKINIDLSEIHDNPEMMK